MAALTRQQVERLAEIIQQHATWFIWRTLGSEAVSPAEVDRLKAQGLLPMDTNINAIKYAFVLGKLESMLKENRWKNLSWKELASEAEGRRLTPIDNLQIQAADLSFYTKFRGLADDIRHDLYQRLADATGRVISEAHVRGTIRDVIESAVDLNRTYQQTARDLVETLKEPTRNWTRVASTEMHAARQRGYANAILNREDVYEDAEGPDSRVAVQPDASACEDCQRLYLDPQTGHPKIYILKELLANEGTNYQRPWRVNARPCIPPLHPHCFCRLVYVPPGWGWDDKGNFTLLDPKAAYGDLT